MSYEQWKQIQDSARSTCAAAAASVEFGGATAQTFGLEAQYNRTMQSELEKIFGFIQAEGLSARVGEQELQQRYERTGAFGDGIAGVSTKYSIIQLLTLKIDRIYGRELGYVDKSEHAFSLLNRKLFLIEELRDKWLKAFDEKTEVRLEQLGGLHLFECGIWSFKVSEPGAATDLILRENIEHSEERLPLIMTEWKKATSASDANAKIEAAKTQCRLYTAGVARPLEVKSHRFIVIVSKAPYKIERTFIEDKVTYLVRNIAIERPTPSVEARHKKF